MDEASAVLTLRADSFLEYAFLRWVLVPGLAHYAGASSPTWRK
jgi:hypothetical protein